MHERAYFCLILEGKSVQTFGLRTRVRETSTIVFYPPEEMQSEHFSSAGGRIFSVELDNIWLRRFQEYVDVGSHSIDYEGASLAWLMSNLYREFRRMDQASPLTIEGLVLEIIAEISRLPVTVSRSQNPPWLKEVRDILHTRFSDRLTLNSLAESVNLHPVYLATAFRKHYRCTIGEYIRRLRIEFACREIAKSDLGLTGIGLAAGFANQAHFSRTFRKLTGITPTEYREQCGRRSRP